MAAKRSTRKKTTAKKAPRKKAPRKAAAAKKAPAKRSTAKKAAKKKVGTRKPCTRKKAPRKRREPVYKPEIRTEIVDWISEGRTLREYCRQAGKPNFVTVYRWLDADEDFRQRFARARDIGEDVIAQECLEIAEDGSNDWMERTGKTGECLGYQVQGEHVQRSKLRIWTRLELLKRWNPKKYGERVSVDQRTEAKVEHSGEVAGPPVPDPATFAAHLAEVARMASAAAGEDDENA